MCSSPDAKQTHGDIRKLEDAPCSALEAAISPRLCEILRNPSDTELLRDFGTWHWNTGFVRTTPTHILTNSSCHLQQWHQL